MGYHKTTLERRWNLLLVGILEKTIKKTNNKHYLQPKLDVYINKKQRRNQTPNRRNEKKKQNKLYFTKRFGPVLNATGKQVDK